MSPRRDAADLANLPTFLKHLGHHERDPIASAFAKRLLEDGGEVIEFWGPEQMDVWRLTVRRDRYLLTFEVERGRPGVVTLRPASADSEWSRDIPLKFAVLGWARAHAVKLVLDDPLHFHTDVLAHGALALEWLSAGNEDVLLRIDAAYHEGLSAFGPIHRPEHAAERAAIQIRMMEDAAAQRLV